VDAARVSVTVISFFSWQEEKITTLASRQAAR
jgi:hypothetical protein